MKPKPKREKRPYEVILLKGGGSLRSVLKAVNRKKAVARAQVKFREEYGDTLRPAYAIMTVTDPYREVTYGPDFNCADGMNRLLPEDVIKRVIAESSGELVPETDTSKGVCLKRIKRKKQQGSWSVKKAPGIRQNKNGDMFYRVTLVPVRSKGGVIVQKKKVKDYRLEAKNIHDAFAEIRSRNLDGKRQFTLTDTAARLLKKLEAKKPIAHADDTQGYLSLTRSQLAERLARLNKESSNKKPKKPKARSIWK